MRLSSHGVCCKNLVHPRRVAGLPWETFWPSWWTLVTHIFCVFLSSNTASSVRPFLNSASIPGLLWRHWHSPTLLLVNALHCKCCFFGSSVVAVSSIMSDYGVTRSICCSVGGIYKQRLGGFFDASCQQNVFTLSFRGLPIYMQTIRALATCLESGQHPSWEMKSNVERPGICEDATGRPFMVHNIVRTLPFTLLSRRWIYLICFRKILSGWWLTVYLFTCARRVSWASHPIRRSCCHFCSHMLPKARTNRSKPQVEISLQVEFGRTSHCFSMFLHNISLNFTVDDSGVRWPPQIIYSLSAHWCSQ